LIYQQQHQCSVHNAAWFGSRVILQRPQRSKMAHDSNTWTAYHIIHSHFSRFVALIGFFHLAVVQLLIPSFVHSAIHLSTISFTQVLIHPPMDQT